MKLDNLCVYRYFYPSNNKPEYGVFWNKEGWGPYEWTSTHLQGNYSEIAKHVEENLPFRLPTKEKLKLIEDKYTSPNVIHAWGEGCVYINLIYEGQFINF